MHDFNIKNGYTGKLDDTVNKYNNVYRRTIKMKPVNSKPNTYIDSGKEINNENLKFKVVDNVKISKCEYIFA